MDLKFDDLKTFIEVYRAGTFTAASKSLGLSQSALSQKISRLENCLNASVFIRHPRKLSLTASGEKLLAYAKQCLQMQEDFLNDFDQYADELSGVIRIAGFSSVMRSIIIPRLKKIILNHPKVSLEFSSHEMFELEDILQSSKADFIVTDYYPNKANTEEVRIGEEEYVEIVRNSKNTSDCYLDHGPHDNATKLFFDYQSIKKNYQRKYMGDVYSILDAVSYGFGRAIMSKHLVDKDKRFKIIKHKKRYIRPLVLSRISQSYYSPLQSLVYEKLTEDHL